MIFTSISFKMLKDILNHSKQDMSHEYLSIHSRDDLKNKSWKYIDETLDSIHKSTTNQEWIKYNTALYKYLLYGPIFWLENRGFREMVRSKIIKTEWSALSHFKDIRASDHAFDPSNRRMCRSILDLLDLIDQMHNTY